MRQRLPASAGPKHELTNIFSHKYQQLPLIPVEEFLAQNPDRATDDENELMYARIEHERAEREGLEQRRQELLKRKQKLIAENTRRKDDLANLDQNLEKFIDVRHTVNPTRIWKLTIAGRETYSGAFRKGAVSIRRAETKSKHITASISRLALTQWTSPRYQQWSLTALTPTARLSPRLLCTPGRPW